MEPETAAVRPCTWLWWVPQAGLACAVEYHLTRVCRWWPAGLCLGMLIVCLWREILVMLVNPGPARASWKHGWVLQPLTSCAEAVGSGWGTEVGLAPGLPDRAGAPYPSLSQRGSDGGPWGQPVQSGLTLPSGPGGLCCGRRCPPGPAVSTPHVCTTGRSPPWSPFTEGSTTRGTSGKPRSRRRCGWKTSRFLCNRQS